MDVERNNIHDRVYLNMAETKDEIDVQKIVIER
jgi:uncharacterized Zn-finger protein